MTATNAATTARVPRYGRLSVSVVDCLTPRALPADPAAWCGRNVWFPSISSASPGLFDLDLYPYERGVLEALCDPNIERVSLQWATQLGKTAIMVSAVQMVASCRPAPMMFAHPTQDSAKKLATEKLLPALLASPTLRKRLPPEHKRQMLSLNLGDMIVDFGWSGSPATFGEKSRQWIFCTEVDKFTQDISDEADVYELVQERVKGFADFKIFSESTPTIKNRSRIERLIAQSDERRYHVPCPRCGGYAPLEWARVRWPKDDNGNDCAPEVARLMAWYECPHCNGRIESHEKPGMIRRGTWCRLGESVADCGEVRGTPERPSRHAGFLLSSLYAMAIDFGRIAEAWLGAKGKPLSEQNFVNGWLGLPYEQPIKSIQPSDVLRHRGQYEQGTIPFDIHANSRSVVILTVDVQEWGLKYVVRAFDAAAGGTSYLVQYGSVGSYADLTRLLVMPWRTVKGDTVKVTHVFVDSGHRTDEVYGWCRANAGWHAMKGRADLGKPWLSSKLANGMVIHTIADGHWKSVLAARIDNLDSNARGAWHLYRGVAEDYANELTAEVCEPKPDARGYIKHVWRKLDGRSNDWLDCEKMALAGADMLGIHSEPEPAEVKAQPKSTPDKFPSQRQWASRMGVRPPFNRGGRR